MAHPNGINERAQSGFAKGAAYDQHRPAYSETVVQLLLEHLAISGKKGARILDLAAGTGKFTESLARREEKYEVVAVEPHDRMRQVLEDKKLPGVTVKGGSAEKIPLDDDSVDAVICAQSLHWFANKTALREIHRVLHRHGSLGMVWNVDDYNAPRGHEASTTWESKAHDLIWSFDDNEARYRHEKWRQVFDNQVKSTPLSLIASGDEQLFSLPLGEQEERYEVWLPKEKIWERFNTLSQIAVLEGEDRDRTHRTFMETLNEPEVETDENGNVAVHGETVVVWTSKIPEEGRDSLLEVERP